MKEKAPPSPKWLRRLFSPFRRHRATAHVRGENRIIQPISTRAIASAESVLRGISNVPGGERVQVRIGGTLELIKELNVVSVSTCFDELRVYYPSFPNFLDFVPPLQSNAHDTNTLRSLEYYVRYLAELLEPFAIMHRDQISPLLQYEVLILGRQVFEA
jgi:hypothetical protein